MRTLNAFWPKVNNTDWNSSDIDTLRGTGNFSKQLIELVWRESRLKGEQKCTKPRLGMEIAKKCLKEEIPDPIKQLFCRAREISGAI